MMMTGDSCFMWRCIYTCRRLIDLSLIAGDFRDLRGDFDTISAGFWHHSLGLVAISIEIDEFSMNK